MPESPQILLPFAEREYISMQRTCRILGLSWTTVYRLAASGMIDLVDYRYHSMKKVRYQSVVELCDRLREEFGIDNPRPQLNPPFRNRDEDLLPFPLTDTINSEQSRQVLGDVTYVTFGKLVEEGRFWAYRFYRDTAWRVSRTSLEAFARRVRSGENVKASGMMYRALPVDL